MICQAVADRADVRKDVERPGRSHAPGSRRRVRRPSQSRSTLLAEPLHVIVAGRRVVLECRLGGPLHKGRAARGGRVDQLADRVDDSGLATANPIRHPLMLYDLLKV